MKYINPDMLRHLFEVWKEIEEKANNDKGAYCYNECINAIDKMPSTDVRENIHGEWIDGNRQTWNGTYWFIYCSECLHERKDCNHDNDTPFCPNCGADMKGETE